MPTIHVDGRSYSVRGDQNLLAVITELRINLPYFCWHPAMGSVGACRQCAVKVYRDESDRQGRIVMACMTPVTEGLRVSVKDPEVAEFRRHVIEWLMVNHPHDCPVCDEGGECHLQDMTVMTGHVYRRYRGRKRTYRNQDLGPFVNHEMNRCIQCYRCVRFYRDYASGRDFDVFACKNHVYFGRFEEGKLESEFSGNLVEICPTGVFTDKTLKRHYTRKWDLETAPSICVHCGLGCNTIPGARYGELRRVHNRFHPEVNGYFLCDRGRYGYEFVNDPRRLRQPQVGRDEHQEASWEQALQHAADSLQECRRVLGIGSPRASLEANYALKVMVGEDAFSPGLSAVEHDALTEALAILRSGPVRSPSLAEVQSADVILILGADPTNEAPLMDLAIRQAVHRAALLIAERLDIPLWNDYPVRDALQQERGKLFIVTSAAVKLEEIATESVHASPPELAAFAWQLSEALEAGAFDQQTFVGRAAEALAAAKQPLLVIGSQHAMLLQAIASITRRLSADERPCYLSVLVPECNSMGVALLGGRELTVLLEDIESGRNDGLIVLENDLFRRDWPEQVTRAFQNLRCLVVMDHLPNQTTALADVVLPATTFTETMGTLVNSEGRAQRFYQVLVPQGEPRPSWRIIRDLMEARRPGSAPWATCEQITYALDRQCAALAGAMEAAPSATWRDRTSRKVAREPHRSSGRTAKDADRTIHEPQPPEDPESPLGFTMEGLQQEPPAALVPRYWYPGWNSVQALNRFEEEVGGPLRGGIPGKRLIEPGSGVGAYCNTPLQAETPLAEDEVWVVPWAAIFGSEELSRLSPSIASVVPPTAIRLHPGDAARWSLAEGELATLHLQEHEYTLPVRLDQGVAKGVVIVPAGYQETAGIVSTERAKIKGVE